MLRTLAFAKFLLVVSSAAAQHEISQQPLFVPKETLRELAGHFRPLQNQIRRAQSEGDVGEVDRLVATRVTCGQFRFS